MTAILIFIYYLIGSVVTFWLLDRRHMLHMSSENVESILITRIVMPIFFPVLLLFELYLTIRK